MAKLSKLGGTLFTQISSGIYRGKKLALPALSSTRSTKSIVKGSFFDTWRAQLRGTVFIECFGGSGAMALEALSNGAKNVYAIEKDAAAHKIMGKILSFSSSAQTRFWAIASSDYPKFCTSCKRI